MLFDIFNIFPYYLHVNYWTGKSVRIFSRKQVISGNFRRYDVYSWVCFHGGNANICLPMLSTGPVPAKA